MKIIDNRFELIGQIAEYPWGREHRAQDKELNRQLRVVEVHRHSPTDVEIRQYLRAQLALAQSPAPNAEQIVALRRAEDGTVFTVFDTQPGASLRSFSSRFDNFDLTPEGALFVIGGIARSLAATHEAHDRQTAQSQRLYHLGLNPQTVQLTADGVRLHDFQFPPSQVKAPEQVAYLAPEQIQGGAVDQRADLFSLGVIAFGLFTGKTLFPQSSVSELMAAILRGNYDLSELTSGDIDDRIAKLIEGCLHLQRNQRLVTAAQLADRCESLLREAGAHPEKRLRELVEKVTESPKLERYPAGVLERVRTRALERSDLEEGTQAMVESSRNDRDDDRRARSGQETRIGAMPVGEKIKRAGRSGMGGSKAVLILGVVAAILVLAVGVILIMKLTSGDGGTAADPDKRELKSGTLTTFPEGVAVYSADSLLGYSPVPITAQEGELLTLKHPCCPDSNIVLDFGRLEQGPFVMKTVVEITSDPAGAKVTVNGQDLDRVTPYRFAAAANDTVSFTVELPGKKQIASGPVALADFASLSIKDIDIRRRSDGGIEFSASLTDRPKVLLVTQPPGATVKIVSTDMEIGATPLQYDFGDDRVMLQLSKDGLESQMIEIPALTKRGPRYVQYLVRRVNVQARDAEKTDQSVSARIRQLIYDGKSQASSESTPASLKVPGIDCRIVLSANGYHDLDTLITPSAREFTAIMRRKEASKPVEEQVVEKKPDLANAASVNVYVVDDKGSPVTGATVTVEYKKKDKETKELGRTDVNGRVTAQLEPLKYKFIATHDQYKKEDESKELKAGQSYVVTIKTKRK